jgi:hypothetical protein
MQPIIPIWLIYFAGVCENISAFFGVLGTVGLIIFIIVNGIYLADEDKLLPHTKKIFAGLIFSLFLANAIPDQKTIYTMMVASQITPKNIELVGGTVKATADYMFDKTEKLIKDVKETK